MSNGTEELFESDREIDDQEVEDLADEPISEEPTKPESAYETAERVLKESEEADEEAETEDAEGAEQSDKVEPAEKRKRGRPRKVDDIEPPAYLSAEEKQDFARQTPEGKKILKETLARHQAKFTQVTQHAQRAVTESKEYTEHANMYLNQHPELVEKGYTGPRLLRELLGAHMTLTGQDRAAAKAKFLAMGKQLGFNLQDTDGDARGQNGHTQQDISQHPQFLALQQQVNETHSDYQQRKQAQQQQVVARITQEIESVQNEKDANGNYLYPKTHEASFLSQVKPLVSALSRTMSYSEALKRAYIATEGPIGNSRQVNQAKLPVNSNNIARQAATAAVSVRGRSVPQGSNRGSDIPADAIKPGMTASETAAYMIELNNR